MLQNGSKLQSVEQAGRKQTFHDWTQSTIQAKTMISIVTVNKYTVKDRT
jgi:hypothetical protein